MKCIHINVQGKVQGVFFRSNTKRKAQELGLKGYAKNLSDGSVEIVAQGDNEKLDELVEFIKKGPGIADVQGLKLNHKEPENFNDFKVV